MGELPNLPIPRPPRTQNQGVANWRPQIEHITWVRQAAWLPLWWWPCVQRKRTWFSFFPKLGCYCRRTVYLDPLASFISSKCACLHGNYGFAGCDFLKTGSGYLAGLILCFQIRYHFLIFLIFVTDMWEVIRTLVDRPKNSTALGLSSAATN